MGWSGNQNSGRSPYMKLYCKFELWSLLTLSFFLRTEVTFYSSCLCKPLKT